MRPLFRLLGLLVAAFVATMVGSAVAAAAAKRRIVPTTDPAANEVTLASIFGPLGFRSTAKSFRGGTLDCWYGGGVLDLRDASLDPAGATLAVRALFGGGQIIVPADWDVTTRVLGIGGVGDARQDVERPANAPHLTLRGWALFGGFALMSELPEGEADWLTQVGAGLGREEAPAVPA
ncbi:MAG: hypothetical protein ACXWPO_09250 [Candidatus Limnocylindrales bacterium]